MVNVPITKTPWKLTLNDRIYIRFVLCLSEDALLLGPPFYLHVTYGTLNLTPLLLFIHLRTNQHHRPRPKAQYIILGPYPYNSPSKFRFFLLSEEKKWGFDFLRVKTINSSDLHCLVLLIIVTDALKPTMCH